MSVGRRQTITISEKNWLKYCTLKGKHLLNMGKPELTFTEYANACIEVSNLEFKDLLELRRREKHGEGHD